MIALLSIVPLETLAGWPEAPNPSPLHSLGLLIGIPLVGGLVIIALVLIRAKLVGDYGAEMHAAAWAGDHPEATIAAGVPPTAIDTSHAPAPGNKALSGKADKTGGCLRDVVSAAELSPNDQARLDRATANAERESGLRFSVYYGVSAENARGYAVRLHAALPDPAHSVLVLCDPTFRALEIVTGVVARRSLDDMACGLAIATMKSSFLGGDVVGGLAHGVQQLGEAARQPATLHLR